MVKSLHRSLEAKLASIKDPEYDESDGDDDDVEQPETISAKRSSSKGGGVNTKRKGKKGSGIKSTRDDSTSNNNNEPSTVIYLGHLPTGFEEREITIFLTQFGTVHRCRVSRSTKTGRSRGYAFVEFTDAEVANIVADTMSGYFLLEKRLVCHVLPVDKVHELMFVKPKKVQTKKDRQKLARVEMNKRRSADALRGITAKLVKREESKRKKLKALGIEYDFPGYKASAEKAAVGVTTEEESKKYAVSSNKKKKRKLSADDDEKEEDEVAKNDENVANESTAKTPKSLKKKKTSNSDAVEEEKENENDVNETTDVVESSTKKKKKKVSKTPKKEKTPKKK